MDNSRIKEKFKKKEKKKTKQKKKKEQTTNKQKMIFSKQVYARSLGLHPVSKWQRGSSTT